MSDVELTTWLKKLDAAVTPAKGLVAGIWAIVACLVGIGYAGANFLRDIRQLDETGGKALTLHREAQSKIDEAQLQLLSEHEKLLATVSVRVEGLERRASALEARGEK